MKDFNITTDTGQKNLPGRREPYWRKLEGTGFLGIRKMKKTAAGNWIARWRDRKGKLHYRPLGKVCKGNNFNSASRSARDWFAQCEQGVPKAGTVEAACKSYVKHQWSQKESDCAQIFKLSVYDTSFGNKRLDELMAEDVEKWLNGLVTKKRAKNSANRIFRSFKAAMNYAYQRGMVANDRAWSVVKAFPVGDGQRKNFLTSEQIDALKKEATPEFESFLQGFLFTGARPGELAIAKVKDLDPDRGVLTLATNKGRTGISKPREFPLSPAAFKFFQKQTHFKQGHDFLITQGNKEPWKKQHWARELMRMRGRVESLPNDLCLYDLRHTVISNWLVNGVNLATVAKICGTSIRMIEHHYFKFVPTDVADQLAAIEIK